MWQRRSALTRAVVALVVVVLCLVLLTACPPQVVYVQPQGATPAPSVAQPPAPHAPPLRHGYSTKADAERAFGQPAYITGEIDNTFWIYAFEDSDELYIVHFVNGFFQTVHPTTRHELQELLRQYQQRGRF